MDTTLIILIILIVLIIAYEFLFTYEKFQVPSPIKLQGNSKNGVINLFWHRPETNYENIYQYLIYIKEDGKDPRMLNHKASDDLFYKKTLLKIDKTVEYIIQVIAVSSDGISEKSNEIILQAKNKNTNPSPTPVPPLVNKITCNPDGTYKISQSCYNPRYPNIDIDLTNHDETMNEMTQINNSHTFNL
jgi:hypothetical protein